jgi:hypothetical protein
MPAAAAALLLRCPFEGLALQTGWDRVMNYRHAPAARSHSSRPLPSRPATRDRVESILHVIGGMKKACEGSAALDSSLTVAPWLAVAHSTPTMLAAAARVSVRGSLSTVGRGPRLARSSLPSSGPAAARALAVRRATVCTQSISAIDRPLGTFRALGHTHRRSLAFTKTRTRWPRRHTRRFAPRPFAACRPT